MDSSPSLMTINPPNNPVWTAGVIPDFVGEMLEKTQAVIDDCISGKAPLKARGYTKPGHPFVIEREGVYKHKFAWTRGVTSGNADLGPTLCIGVFELRPRFRGLGLFRAFMERANTLTGVEAVMFENVFDTSLREYLEDRGYTPLNWHEPLDIFLFKPITKNGTAS